MEFTTSDLSDAHLDAVTLCEVQFRSFGRRKVFAGPCYTAKVYEDNRKLRQIISEPGAGRVLVVDGGASTRIALFGDKMAALAAGNGWAGAVLYGGIRDSAEIDLLHFGIKALGTTARRSEVDRGGEAGVPVRFGNAEFRPGWWVYVDQDAVLVSKEELKLPPITSPPSR